MWVRVPPELPDLIERDLPLTKFEDEEIERANVLLSELAALYPKLDKKTKAKIKSETAGLTLECEYPGELRIFCIFHYAKDSTYRVTQADVCFVDNLIKNTTFTKAIISIIKAGIKAGEKIDSEELTKAIIEAIKES